MIDDALKQLSGEEIEDRIKAALVAGLKLKVDPRTIASELPLVERGLGLDSLAVLQLIGFIEDEFGIRIDDADLSRTLFRDVRSIADYVRSRLNEAG